MPKMSVHMNDETYQLFIAMLREEGHVNKSKLVSDCVNEAAKHRGFVLIPARVERREVKHERSSGSK